MTDAAIAYVFFCMQLLAKRCRHICVSARFAMQTFNVQVTREVVVKIDSFKWKIRQRLITNVGDTEVVKIAPGDTSLVSMLITLAGFADKKDIMHGKPTLASTVGYTKLREARNAAQIHALQVEDSPEKPVQKKLFGDQSVNQPCKSKKRTCLGDLQMLDVVIGDMTISVRTPIRKSDDVVIALDPTSISNTISVLTDGLCVEDLLRKRAYGLNAAGVHSYSMTRTYRKKDGTDVEKTYQYKMHQVTGHNGEPSSCRVGIHDDDEGGESEVHVADELCEPDELPLA